MIYYIINTIGVIGLIFYQYKRYKIIKDIKDIKFEKTYKYLSRGWSRVSVAPDYTWDVSFTLKEVLTSTNKKMTQFIILDVISHNTKYPNNSTIDIENYKEKFYTSTGGGWLKTNNENLLEYEPISINEKRARKLAQLGIK